MNRGNPQNPRSEPSPAAEVFSRSRGRAAVFLALSFLVNFTLYVMTVAPTVTFEDSGELISAAYHLGVAHEPGYPLFTMLGKLFTLLPLGTVAFRVNLMSAFFTALAGVFVFLAAVGLIESVFTIPLKWKKCAPAGIETLKYSAGLCACILFGTALSSWEQAVITEVYGLNSFFTGLFVFLIVLLSRQREYRKKCGCFYAVCLVMGLSLTNHTTSAMFVPLFGIYILLTDRKVFKDFALLAKSSGFFVAGLLPLVYLPLAARRNPVINWGDPENLSNFIRVITRHQYGGKSLQSVGSFLAQFGVFAGELLTKQWFPLLLLFAVAGCIALFKKNRPFFFFAIAFLAFSMPVMTWMTNFDVTTPAVAFEHKALVSVFYIPAYLFIALLMGMGIFYALSLIPMQRISCRVAALMLPVAVFAGSGAQNFTRVSLHGYECARIYADNIFSTLPQNAVLFVHWDPFCFPLIYYQAVERKRPDLLVLDQMLLKRTWYVTWLRRRHPEFARRFEKEMNAFLTAVEPFENNRAYNGDLLQRSYIGMIAAFIDTTIGQGRDVYATYTPEPGIMRGYRLEPVFSAYKFVAGDRVDTTLSDTACDITAFTDPEFPADRMKKYFREYYGNLYGLRAMVYEGRGNKARARSCYRWARKLFTDGSQQAFFIDGKLTQLGP